MKLREEQAEQRAERKRVTAQLKNTQRRKRRLAKRARQLTNADLVELLLLREADADEKNKGADGEADVADEEKGTASRTTEKPCEEEEKDKDITSDDDEARSSPGAASSMQPS